MKAVVRAKLVGTIADFNTPEYQPTDESETEYVKLTDNHIDSALKQIMREYGGK